MKVSTISYRKCITVNIDRFQFVKIEIGSDAELNEGENPKTAIDKLRNLVMDELDAELAAIKGASHEP